MGLFDEVFNDDEGYKVVESIFPTDEETATEIVKSRS